MVCVTLVHLINATYRAPFERILSFTSRLGIEYTDKTMLFGSQSRSYFTTNFHCHNQRLLLNRHKVTIPESCNCWKLLNQVMSLSTFYHLPSIISVLKCKILGTKIWWPPVSESRYLWSLAYIFYLSTRKMHVKSNWKAQISMYVGLPQSRCKIHFAL